MARKKTEEPVAPEKTAETIEGVETIEPPAPADRVLRSEHYIARLDADAATLLFWRDGSVGATVEVPVGQVNELAFLLLRFDTEKLEEPPA